MYSTKKINPNLQCVFYLKRIWQEPKRNSFNFKHINLQKQRCVWQRSHQIKPQADSNLYEDNELPDQAKSAPLSRPFRSPTSSSLIEPKINIKKILSDAKSESFDIQSNYPTCASSVCASSCRKQSNPIDLRLSSLGSEINTNSLFILATV